MKMAFWIVFVAGFVACSALGIGPVLKRMGGDWTSVPMLLGIALGVAILALAVMFATGARPGPLSSDWTMLWALVGIVGVKAIVGTMAMSGVWGPA